MALVPDIATNITSTGTRIYNYMQALHDWIVLNSNWTVTLATALDNDKLTAPTVGAGGSGYSVGDLLTLSSGTSTDPATVRVTAESAGVVTAVEVAETGDYTVNPTFPSATTGGGDNLCTINGTMVQHTAGTHAFTIRSLDNATELCFINAGTKATPDLATAKVGVNPDGLADAIVNTETPWVDASNFSGSSLINMRSSWVTQGARHEQFTWIEWPDAAMFLLKNDLRTFYPYGWHAGKIFQPAFDFYSNVGDVRVSGHGILGSIPRIAVWTTTPPVTSWIIFANTGSDRQTGTALRVGVGQAIPSTNVSSSSWTLGAVSTNASSTVYANKNLVGPSSLYQPHAFAVHFNYDDTSPMENAIRGFYKYIHACKQNEVVMTKYASGGEDVYLVVRYSTASPNGIDPPFFVPIPNGFVVNP
jgi:hypothetical protein